MPARFPPSTASIYRRFAGSTAPFDLSNPLPGIAPRLEESPEALRARFLAPLGGRQPSPKDVANGLAKFAARESPAAFGLLVANADKLAAAAGLPGGERVLGLVLKLSRRATELGATLVVAGLDALASRPAWELRVQVRSPLYSSLWPPLLAGWFPNDPGDARLARALSAPSLDAMRVAMFYNPEGNAK